MAGEQGKILDQDKRIEESLVFFFKVVKFLARGGEDKGSQPGGS